jgi:hypothetical protein
MAVAHDGGEEGPDAAVCVVVSVFVLAMVVPVLTSMCMILVVRLRYSLVRMGVLVLVHVSSLA